MENLPFYKYHPCVSSDENEYFQAVPSRAATAKGGEIP